MKSFKTVIHFAEEEMYKIPNTESKCLPECLVVVVVLEISLQGLEAAVWASSVSPHPVTTLEVELGSRKQDWDDSSTAMRLFSSSGASWSLFFASDSK